MRDELEALRLTLRIERELHDVGSFERVAHVVLRAVVPHFRASAGVVLAASRSGTLHVAHRMGKHTWDEDLVRQILASGRAEPPDGVLFQALYERGKRIAVLLLARETSFDREDLAVLRRVGNVVHQRLDAMAEERVVDTLARIERKISSELRTVDLLYLILDSLQRLVRYDHSASILLVDREHSRLEVRAEKIVWRKMKSPHVHDTLTVSEALTETLRVAKRAFLLQRDDDRLRAKSCPLFGDDRVRAIADAELVVFEELYDLLCYSCRSGVGPPEVGMLVVPLLFGGRLLGLAKLSALSGDAFTPADVSVVGRFVEKMSTGIRNAKHYQRRLDELRAINEIGQLVTRGLPLESTCQSILEVVLSVMHLPVGSIELLDADTSRLRQVASVGYRPGSEGLSLEEGILGEVVRSGRAVVANDVSEHRSYVRHAENTRSELAVPIVFEGVTRGVLNVESAARNRFRDRDVEFLSILADKTAIALETLEQRQRQQDTLHLLYELSARLAVPDDSQKLMQLAVDVTRKHLSCEVASIFLFEEGRYRRRASSGTPNDWFADESFSTGEGLTGRAGVLQRGPYPPPVVHNDVPESAEALPRILKRYREKLASGRIAHLVAVPLLEKRRPIGVLRVLNRLTRDGRLVPGGFTKSDVALLSAIASQVSLAAANLHKQERIESMRAELEDQVRERTAEVQRLATFVENAPLAIFWIDENGVLQFVNEAGEKMFGFQAAELQGRRVDGEGSGILGDQFQSLEQVVGFMNRWSGEVECHRSDQSTFPAYLSARSLQDSDDASHGMVVFARDITATKDLEQQLVASEGKRAMADLASSVAHDVNNALGSSLPMIQALADDLAEGHFERDQFLDDLRQIESYTRVSIRIFQGMLSMTRGTFSIDQVVDINNRIATALDLVSFKLQKANVHVARELTEDLPPIMAHPGRLEQAFHNLILNSIDAMPDGGTLTLRTFLEDDRVVAEVIDTGVGIPEELLARVEEPFYTSKRHGTGLGLSIVRSIVWEHNGKLHISSREGRGTTIRMEFPALEKT